MKNLMTPLLTLTLLLSFSQTDLWAQANPGKGKKDVPPGLQKKGGLPPGQAKKLNKSGKEVDTNKVESVDKAKPVKETAPTAKAPTANPKAPAPGTPKAEAVKPAGEPAAAGKTEKPKPAAPPLTKVDPNKKVSKDLESRRNKLAENVNELNQLGRDQASREKILDRLSKSTRVSVAALESQLKAHPGLGAGDLYVAHMIAKKGKQPVDRILAQHEAGHSWGVLANEYQAGLPDLIDNTQQTEAAAKKSVKR